MSRSFLGILGGVFAIIGGGLIILSGFTSQGILLTFLNSYQSGLIAFVPAIVRLPVELALLVIAFLIGLGGVVVVFGGLLVLYNHRFTGRLLIDLGGGVGFIGLVVAIFYSVIVSGFPSLVTHSEYWLGVLLATIGRWLAKK